MNTLKITYHRNAEITFWSVYQQRWVRVAHIADAELAAMPPSQRLRVCRHLGISI